MDACIMCGQRAGSREHVFPASLGGRRTNKGIYCKAHNNSLAPLADTLAKQLRIFNALLAVKPDHQSKAKPFDYVSRQGDELTVFDGKITRKTSSTIEGTMHLSLDFGGSNGLRAIAYVALTFLAHAFPRNAAMPKLATIKSFITNGGKNAFVWWEGLKTIHLLPAYPFQFGHTIAVMSDAVTGRQTAFISLFGSLNFGIDMGVIDSASSSTALYFIDPLAHHPPDDIVENRFENPLLVIVKPSPIQQHLIEMVQRDQSDHIQNLLARIERWTFDRELESWLLAINTSRGNAEQLVGVLRQGIERNQDKVYRLLRYVAEEAPLLPGGSQILQGMFATAIERSEGNPAALTPLAAACLEAAVLAVTREIAMRAAKSEIVMDDLYEILNSGPGAALAGQAALTVMLGDLVPESLVSPI